MKICIVTDTWQNINGVVTTLKNITLELEKKGHEVFIIEPSQFKNFSPRFYPELNLSINIWKVSTLIENFNPDAIHIATEGPLGLAARWYCKVKKNNIPHNTSYHTKFPEYLKIHFKIPLCISYFFMRLFHKFSQRILVTTDSMKNELETRGFKNLIVWTRGVDESIFNRLLRNKHNSIPTLLFVSRASKEKNIEAFCELKINSKKIFIGDGPHLNYLKQKYPEVLFLGYKSGLELAYYYANADVFVFPSKSDTFGIVMLESLACGTPVAAYPVTGPIDIIENNINGYLDNNLELAVIKSLQLDREKVKILNKKYTWAHAADIFLDNLIIINKGTS